MSAAAALLASVVATSSAASGANPSLEWLGYPRAVSRSWSASRDTPALNMIAMPRFSWMGGGELALFSLRWPCWTLRGGFAGFVELEHDGVSPDPWTRRGRILWRGSYAFYAAAALDAAGRRLCPGCELEITAQGRHESQHYTGSNQGGEGEDVSEQPYVGDDLIVDVALSERLGPWLFAERVIGMLFEPEDSSYAAGGGLDLHARFLAPWPAHPFTSLYAEYRWGDDLHGREFPDAYRLRALLGVALPSSLGDILVYGFGNVGHRYGVRILSEEASLGFGVRLTLGARGADAP